MSLIVSGSLLASEAGANGPERSGAIEGVVRDAAGAPVAGALVAAMPMAGADVGDGMRPAAMARSRADGSFRIDGVSDGTYAATATTPQLAAAFRADVKVVAGDTAKGVDLVMLANGVTISGVIRNTLGTGASYARVHAARISELQGDVFHVDADVDGRYAITLPEARYVVEADAGSLRSQQASANGPGDRMCDLVVEPTASGSTPSAVTEWIKDHAIRLDTAEAGHGFADMQPLKKIVGDARIVSLGEATHGTREFFQLKHRMLEFLATEMGFTAFGIEASFPDALAVNDYVLEGKGDPVVALAGLGFWTWDTQEVLEMIRWMRRFNDDAAHSRKLEFWGFDMQNPPASAKRLVDYLETVDPEGAASAAKALASLEIVRGYGQLSEDVKKATADGIAAIRQRLVDRKDAYVAKSSMRDWELAMQHVSALRQGEEMYRAPDGAFAVRDRSMAENVKWIADSHPPGTKLVLWAHNGHVAIAKASLSVDSMGVHLKRMFGSEMVVFGFAFNQGSFQAREMPFGPSSTLRPFTVPPAPEESLDAALASTGVPLFALAWRDVPRSGPVGDWIRTRRPTRSIGAGFGESMAASFFMSIQPTTAFDAMLFVEKTASARPNRELSTKAYRDSIGVGAATSTSPKNLDFEDDDVGKAPSGWIFPKASETGGYRLEITDDRPEKGKRAARLQRREPKPASVGFGTVMQAIDATPYRGKKIRYRAAVRSDGGKAQLWLRVDKNGGGGFFDNMGNRPVTSTEWGTYEIVGDVAADAQVVNFGMILVGDGAAWLDDVSLEVVN